MFALFNFSTQELLVLLVGGLFCTAVIAGLVVLILVLTRSQGHQSSLESENQRLRDELARRQQDQG
jgi:hypothetical protein